MFHVKHHLPDIQISYRNVSRETFRAINELSEKNGEYLDRYISRLLWWNKTVNLVSRNATVESVRNHVNHSLFPSILPTFTESGVVLDAGSGGGLPGFPLAICFPEKKVVLNDISSKKTTVLSRLKSELNVVNASISSESVDGFIASNPNIDCIVSKHAFKISDILNKASCGNWSHIVLLKGDDFKNELSDIPYPVTIDTYPLGDGTDLSFYTGKMMLDIQRI